MEEEKEEKSAKVEGEVEGKKKRKGNRSPVTGRQLLRGLSFLLPTPRPAWADDVKKKMKINEPHGPEGLTKETR